MEKDYNICVNAVLSNTSDSRNIDIKSGKQITYMLQLDDRLISFLRSVKKSLYTNLYKELYPKVSQSGVMYVCQKSTNH